MKEKKYELVEVKKKKKGRPSKKDPRYKPKVEPKKHGRKQIELDVRQFEVLCSIQCMVDEIAAVFDCSPDTVRRWCLRHYKREFSEVYEEKRQVGLASLRRIQFKMAEQSASMAIWLGKQLLNQKDKIETTNTFLNTPTVEIVNDTPAVVDPNESDNQPKPE